MQCFITKYVFISLLFSKGLYISTRSNSNEHVNIEMEGRGGEGRGGGGGGGGVGGASWKDVLDLSNCKQIGKKNAR